MKSFLSRQLSKLVPRESKHPTGSRKALVVAVSTLKGGVGKTTTSVNLAAGMASRGKAVLLIDIDPQASVRTALSSRLPEHTPDLSLVFRAEDPQDILDVRVHSLLKNLDLALAGPGLTQVASELSSRIAPERLLRKAIEVARTHYDLILIDTPPELGVLSLNALCACDRVLVPVEASALSLDRIDTQLRALAEVAERLNPEIDLLGILLTRVDGRYQRSNEEILSTLRASFGELLLPFHIGASSSLNRAHHAGVDVFSHDPKSRGAQAYNALCDWLSDQMDTVQR